MSENNAAPAPEAGGGFDWMELGRTMAIMYVANGLIKMFFTPEQNQVVKSNGGLNATEIDLGENLLDQNQPKQKSLNVQTLSPLMTQGQPFHFDVWFSFDDDNFWLSESLPQPIWQSEGYDLTYQIHEKNQRQLNLTLPLNEYGEMVSQNKTLYLHFQLSTPDLLSSIKLDSDFSNQPNQIFRSSISLVKYMKQNKVEKVNLLSQSEAPSTQQDDDKFYPHWKKEININLVCDSQNYDLRTIPKEISQYMTIDKKSGVYHPIIYLSDFWQLKKDYIPINETLDALNITLNFQNYPIYYFQFQKSFEMQLKQQEEIGLQTMDLDEMKRIWIETDPILLAVTMTVSLLHSLFEILAFKNDISFWKNKDSMEGISVKSLYFHTIQSFIIFLYLCDNETSWMILASSGFGIVLEIWKIKKASKVVKKEGFPYFRLEDKETYAENSTKEYDDIAMTYMQYSMFPIIGGYSIYSIMYNEHKSWYSFVLNTLVGCIYMFGFINMTPQLYINYRLKSVEHMPGRAMIYRFLNTIIDDLFSFVITMPTMHRISCFRDDVIFVIYLYQRWIYRVDKTRGMYATEQAEEVLGKKVDAIQNEEQKAQGQEKAEEAEKEEKSQKNDVPENADGQEDYPESKKDR